jgi:hypothetical protein
MKLYMFRAVPLPHHQEFIHCTLGTGICHTGLKIAFEQDQDGSSVPVNKLLMMGQRNSPKHVEFHAGVNLGN